MIKAQFFLATLLFAIMVQADVLKDPTQPPAVLNSNSDLSDSNSINTTPKLQSVILGAQYKAAIISGKKVFLGKKYEQATLIKLNENSAVLRNEDGSTQTLTIDYGAIKKTNVIPSIHELKEKNNVKRNTQNKANTK
ncbi:MAG: hypothetical protein Q8M99_01655 [Methylotenera sp.]|nr:hypothetical protein [Methylotenera sp.]